MKIALIGHRGVGKTSFLKRMQSYLPNSEFSFLCLDEEIEKQLGQSISQFFAKKGEEPFRELEIEVFNRLNHDKDHLVIALGAGFLGKIPSDFRCLWLERAVDLSQSRFLNRPNLGKDINLPAQRFQEREERYGEWAHWRLQLIEHVGDYCLAEEAFCRAMVGESKIKLSHANFTPRSVKELESLAEIYDGPVELRDDLLTANEIEEIVAHYPGPVLLSFRQGDELLHLTDKVSSWDWASELGDCPKGGAPILSCHQRDEDLQVTLKKWSDSKGSTIKLALPVYNFSELIAGYRWWQEDPDHRVFLPLSGKGRWQWFRQWMARQYSLNFFRMGREGLIDQPTLLQTLYDQNAAQGFAALLGQPVLHSLTPSFHREFFKESKMATLAVDLSGEEFAEALPFLEELGMKCAAVTSPLKSVAAEWINESQPINTLALNDDQWVGANTDVIGLGKSAQGWADKATAVWGGGGTHQIISEVFKNVAFYSSRTGEAKGSEIDQPQVIVWAVGRQAFSQQGVMPPIEWQPEVVLDLNYTQDSPGIACAEVFSCKYESGLTMFREQGLAQQKFWSEYVGK